MRSGLPRRLSRPGNASSVAQTSNPTRSALQTGYPRHARLNGKHNERAPLTPAARRLQGPGETIVGPYPEQLQKPSARKCLSRLLDLRRDAAPVGIRPDHLLGPPLTADLPPEPDSSRRQEHTASRVATPWRKRASVGGRDYKPFCLVAANATEELNLPDAGNTSWQIEVAAERLAGGWSLTWTAGLVAVVAASHDNQHSQTDHGHVTHESEGTGGLLQRPPSISRPAEERLRRDGLSAGRSTRRSSPR